MNEDLSAQTLIELIRELRVIERSLNIGVEVLDFDDVRSLHERRRDLRDALALRGYLS